MHSLLSAVITVTASGRIRFEPLERESDDFADHSNSNISYFITTLYYHKERFIILNLSFLDFVGLVQFYVIPVLV